MKKDVAGWMKSGEYLPKFMRDFHDQKHLFKAIHRMDFSKNEYCKDVSWVTGHCYVVDIFLWWMAKRGYTLQKTRVNADFRDLAADVEESEKESERQMASLLTPLDKKEKV